MRQYVANLGRRLVAVSDRPRLPLRVHGARRRRSTPSRPGGYIFVTRGLLEEVENEAELASVLAHEIVHVAGWHSIGMIQRQMGMGTLTTLGAIASGVSLGPEAMLLVMQTGQLFTSLYLLGYSREHELEADRVGLRYMLSARYDPEAALSFFERLATLEKKKGPMSGNPTCAPTRPPNNASRKPKPISTGRIFQAETERGERVYRELKSRLPRLKPEERGEIKGRRFALAQQGVVLTIPEGFSWEPVGATTLVAFRRDGGEALASSDGGPDRDLDPRRIRKKFSEDRKWRFLQGRPVLYPAGYGYLG
ncbi:MAG: M48 family metalloprotease [Elusimicrobia bacterium]|nr:M48 family metalloprotease [Elusimicrobiota bacterium]